APLSDRQGWLRGADLVVGELERGDGRALVHRGGDVVGIDPAIPVDRQLDDLEAELLELLQAVEDGGTPDGAGHDTGASGLARPRGPLQREVQGLGAAAGEDDLARPGVHLARDPLVRVIEGSPGAPPDAMWRV